MNLNPISFSIKVDQKHQLANEMIAPLRKRTAIMREFPPRPVSPGSLRSKLVPLIYDELSKL
jgi:hypothetical protein